MNTLVIVDEGDLDTAAGPIADTLRTRGATEIVTLAEFLRTAGVRYDEETGYLTSDRDVFDRAFPEGERQRICNRVVQISRETASVLDGARNVLATNFIFSVYADVLARFPDVLGTPGLYSSTGHLLALNLQWQAFAKRIDDIETPRFAYGFAMEELDVRDFHEPLWKSPFDLYAWQTSGAAQPFTHPFVVDKPSGEPVIAYFVGDANGAFALRSKADLDETTSARIEACMPGVRDAFKAFMGECLFFVDGPRIVFAAFSHHLKTSITHERFASVLKEGLS